MSDWVWPAYVGVVLGLTLFAMVFGGVLVVQARLYGGLSVRRLLGAGALAVYAVALAAYTLLPIPSGDLAAWCAEHAVVAPQLRPFQFVDDIRLATDGLAWDEWLTSRVVLQVAFNVVLFIPWGILARRFFGRGIVVATLSAFAMSLLIELTQATGIFGLIGCAYRVGDVDDLMTNTLGGLIGALVAPIVLGWMPQSRELAARRMEPRPVTVWRRWAGMAIDAIAWFACGAVLLVGYRLARLALGLPIEVDPDSWVEWAIGLAVPTLLLFVLPIRGSGASWGQRAMWLRPADRSGRRPSRLRRVIRTLAGGGGWATLYLVAYRPGAESASWELAIYAWVAAALVGVLLTANRRGISGLVAGTRLVDAREGPAPFGTMRPPTPCRAS